MSGRSSSPSPTAHAAMLASLGPPPNYKAPSPISEGNLNRSRPPPPSYKPPPPPAFEEHESCPRPPSITVTNSPVINGSPVLFDRQSRDDKITSNSYNRSRSPSPFRSDDEKEERKAYLRTKVINEIIETEKRYVEDIKFIVDCYYKPMKEKMLSTEQIKLIFSTLPSILQLNEQLLVELEKYQRGETDKNIAKIFLGMIKFFKIYSSYCSNHDTATQELSKIQSKNKEVRVFMEEVKKKKESRLLVLSDFLIKPVQRITKYPLLISELLKLTNQDDPEFEDLEQLLPQMKEITTSVNQHAHILEGLQKVIDISEHLLKADDFQLVSPSRHFIREGAFKLYVDKKAVKNKRQVFLFSDGLLLTEPTASGYYEFKKFITLDSFITIQHEKTDSNYILLLDDNGLMTVELKLEAPNVEIKKQWFDDITRVRAAIVKVEARLIDAERNNLRTSNKLHLSSGDSPKTRKRSTSDETKITSSNDFEVPTRSRSRSYNSSTPNDTPEKVPYLEELQSRLEIKE